MATVIVPWRGGCPHRYKAWAWVRDRYRERFPDWTLVQATADQRGAWCKATAAMPAIEAASDGTVIVADADVWCDDLDRAVAAVESGLAKWAVPHFLVRRLDEDATDQLIAPGTRMGDGSAVISGSAHAGMGQAQPPYRGLLGGGFVVAHRDTLVDTPLDPRFTGWGQEDASWAVALNTLHGFAWRGVADLIHLWHPPQERMNRKTGSVASQQLHRRYLAARRDPAAMRTLIEEGRRESQHATQHAGHGHPPLARCDV